MLEENGYLLRIFIGEHDKYEGKPLYEWIVKKAKAEGLAGCTVFRGMTGFGAHSQIHTVKIMDLSVDLPIIVEIVDSLERIEAFLPTVDAVVQEGLATLERVHIRLYRPKRRAGTE